MSQYPVPYSSPQPYVHDPYGVYLGPARRAGTLMLVLGAVGLTCAGCMVLAILFAPMQTLIAQQGISIPSAAETGVQPETYIRVMYGVLAGVSVLVSLLLLVLAIFVRRGSAVAIIMSIVIDSLILLFLGMNLIGTLLQLPGSPAAAIIGLLMILVLAGAFVLLLVWLIQAIKATSALRAAQAQYQQQYWQYQQQQQMYGYGYAQPASQQPQQSAPLNQTPTSAPPSQGAADDRPFQG